MTVRIKSDRFRLWLKIPLCLVGTVLKISVKHAQKKTAEGSAKIQLGDGDEKAVAKELVAALRMAKKIHGKLELVYAESEDGDLVKITL